MFVAGYLGSCLASAAGWCACSAFQVTSREVMAKSARLAYSFLFFLGLIVAWILRDFARPLLEKIPWIMRSAVDFEPSDKWFGQQAVYRVSMGNFLFFGTLSLAMIGVRYKSDKRDLYLHHGNWMVKLLLWTVFAVIPFFLPNNLVMGYAWLARFGSGVFLVIQMIILLDFTFTWNEAWVERAEEDERWYKVLLAITAAAYAGVIATQGLLYYWFKPAAAGSCSLNVGLITLTLLLCAACSVLSVLSTSRHASLLPAAVISLYATYLAYSALQSEPVDYACNGLGQRFTAASGSTLVLGMIVTLLSVVYAAFRAGSNTQLFTLSDDDDDAAAAASGGLSAPLLPAAPLTSAGLDGADAEAGVAAGAQAMTRAGDKKDDSGIEEFAPVTYNYAFFHLIFALASMYIAMLMTGWGTVEQEKDRIDVGWTSVWVKFGAQWVTVALYCWSLMAPQLLPERDFS